MSNILDNTVVLVLNRKKLESGLKARGISLSRVARECGISRQSLYDMFRGKSIFSVPFEKLLNYTGFRFEEILNEVSRFETIIADAPRGVQMALLKLQKFAGRHGADIFLIGSRARGKKGMRPDWDFAIHFPEENRRRPLARLKQEMGDMAFPHRVDLVDLNSAPEWFLGSIDEEAIAIKGTTTIEEIIKNRRRMKEAA